MLYLWVVIAFVDNLYLGQKTRSVYLEYQYKINKSMHKILKEPNDWEKYKKFYNMRLLMNL